MLFSTHSSFIKDFPFSEGVCLECGNSTKNWTKTFIGVSPFWFKEMGGLNIASWNPNQQGKKMGETDPIKGFMMGFPPSNVAHLAIVKEQSREDLGIIWCNGNMDGAPIMEYGIAMLINHLNGESDIGSNPVIISCLFPNTSIKQFLLVPAMSTLTTGDLDVLRQRVVTSVVDHLSTLTVQSGERAV